MIQRFHIKLLFVLFFAAILQLGFNGNCWSSDRKETEGKELKHHQHEQHKHDQHQHDQRKHDQHKHDQHQHEHDQHKHGQHQSDQRQHERHQHDQQHERHHKEKAADGKKHERKEAEREKLKEHHKEKTTKKQDRRETEKEKLKAHHKENAGEGKHLKGAPASAIKAKKKLDQYIEKIAQFPPLEGLGFAEIKFDQTNDDNSTSFTASMKGQISIPVPDFKLLGDTVKLMVPDVDINLNVSTPYSYPLARAEVPLWFGVETEAEYKGVKVAVSLSFWGDEKDVYVDARLIKSFKLSDFEYVAEKVNLNSFKIPMQEEFGFTNPASYSINNPEFIFNISKVNVTVYGDVKLADRDIGVYLYQVPKVDGGNMEQLDTSAGYAKAKKEWNLMFDFGALELGDIIKKVTEQDLGTGKVENLLMILSLVEIDLPVKYFDRTIRTSYLMATGTPEWGTHIVGEGVSFLTGLNPNHFSEIKKYLDELNLHFENNLILMGDAHFKVVKAEAEDDGEGDESDDGKGDGSDGGEGEESDGSGHSQSSGSEHAQSSGSGDDGEDEEGEEEGEGSMEPAYELYLAAQLPTWEIPQDWQKMSIVKAEGTDMSFFIKVIPGAAEFGVATDFMIKIGDDHLKLTGALEAVVTNVDIGIALAGMMRGVWNIPYSPGLALKDPTIKIKITEDDSYFGGVSGTTYLAGKEVMVGGDIEVQYTGEEAHPKAGAIKGSLNSLGFQDLAKIANVCVAIDNETWMPWDVPEKPIDVKNLIVDVEIRDVYFEFVTPGAADPDLGFAGTGFAMAGSLYVNGQLLGKILYNINELGVKGLYIVSDLTAKGLEPYTDTFEVYMKDLEEYIVGLEKIGITKFSYLKGIKELDLLIKEYILVFDKIEGYAFSALKEIEELEFDGYTLKFALNTSELPYFGFSTGFLALNQQVTLNIQISINGITVDVDFPDKKLISQYVPDITIRKATLNKDMGIDIEAAITLQGVEVDLEGVVDLKAKSISLTGKLAKLTASSIVEAGGSVTISGTYDGDNIDLKADAEGNVKISGVSIPVKGSYNKDGVPDFAVYFPDDKIVSKNAPDITIKKATLNKDLIDLEAAITLKGKEVDIAGTLDLNTKALSLTAQGQNIPAGSFSVADASVTVSGTYDGDNSALNAEVEGSIGVAGSKIVAKGIVNKDGTLEISVDFPDTLISNNAPDITINKAELNNDGVDIEATITVIGAGVTLAGKLDLNTNNLSLTANKSQNLSAGSFNVANASVTVSGKYDGSNSNLKVTVTGTLGISKGSFTVTGQYTNGILTLSTSGHDSFDLQGGYKMVLCPSNLVCDGKTATLKIAKARVYIHRAAAEFSTIDISDPNTFEFNEQNATNIFFTLKDGGEEGFKGVVSFTHSPSGAKLDWQLKDIDKGFVFSNLDLSNMSFAGLTMDSVTFDTITMPNCSFKGASLKGSVIKGSTIQGDFSNANLNKASISNTDFHKSIFDNGNLSGVSFTDSFLNDTSFVGATLNSVKISSTDFQTSNFESAVFKGSTVQGFGNFTGANFTSASISDSDFGKSIFDGGKLSSVSFTNSSLNNARFCGATLDSVKITSTDFQNSNFENAVFKGATVQGFGNFTGSNFTSASISGSNFGKSIFDKANLSSVSFTHSYLNDTSFVGATLNNVKISSTDFQNSNFENAVLKGATVQGFGNFTGANFNNASISDSVLSKSIFDKGNLAGVSFTNSTLNNTSYVGATLNGVKISGTDFQTSNFENASFKGAPTIQGNFQSSSFNNCAFDGATINDSGMNKCTFYKTSFQSVNINNSDLTSSSLNGAVFANATIIGATMKYVVMQSAQFTGTIKSSNLDGLHFGSSSFNNSTLIDSSIEIADLTGSEFKNSHIENTLFANSKFEFGSFYGSDFKNVNLTNCNLRQVNLSTVAIKDVVFSGSDMNEASYAPRDEHGAHFDNMVHQPERKSSSDSMPKPPAPPKPKPLF